MDFFILIRELALLNLEGWNPQEYIVQQLQSITMKNNCASFSDFKEFVTNTTVNYNNTIDLYGDFWNHVDTSVRSLRRRSHTD